MRSEDNCHVLIGMQLFESDHSDTLDMIFTLYELEFLFIYSSLTNDCGRWMGFILGFM